MQLVKDAKFRSDLTSSFEQIEEEIQVALNAPARPLDYWMLLQDHFEALARLIADVVVGGARDAFPASRGDIGELFAACRLYFGKMDGILQRTFRESIPEATQPAHRMVLAFIEGGVGRAVERVNEVLLFGRAESLKIRVPAALRERAFRFHEAFRILDTFPLAERASPIVQNVLARVAAEMVGLVDSQIFALVDVSRLGVNAPEVMLSMDSHLAVFSHLEGLGTSIPPIDDEYNSVFRWMTLVVVLQLLHPPFRREDLEDRILNVAENFINRAGFPIPLERVQSEMTDRLAPARSTLRAYVELCERKRLPVPARHLIQPAL